MSRRRRFSVVCTLVFVCALYAAHPSAAQFIDPERWFPAQTSEAEHIGEADFVGCDPRYLQMLRTLAEAVMYLSESSVEIEIGQRTSQLMNATEYNAYLEQVREMQAQSAATGRDASGFDIGNTEPSGDPDKPYRQTYEHGARAIRLFAGQERLHTQELTDWNTSVEQRAWGGRQSWWIQRDDTDPHAAQLSAASSPTSFPRNNLNQAWTDVRLLSQMLAALIASGSPDQLLEESGANGVVLHMTWRNVDAHSTHVVTDPKRGYAPVEWSQRYAFNRYEADRAEMEEQIADWQKYQAKATPDEMVDFEETLRYLENELADLRAAPLEEVTQTYRITSAHESSAYIWLPKRIEKVSEERNTMAKGEAQADPSEQKTVGMPPGFEIVEWIAWTDIRGRVTPREAFTQPLEYEAYTGQQWVDLTAPADVDDRSALADRLREGIVLMPGQDPYGKGRWLVADADDALLGQWPIQPGDVFLLAGCTCLEPLEIEPDEEGRGPIEKIAQAIKDAEPDNPATLRVAREDQLIDIVCWVPESESPEARLAMQQAMLKSHEYDPLPCADDVAFAKAVLQATHKLVRGG